MCVRARACVCVCVREREYVRACVCVCVCARAFVLYALNFKNMRIERMCKRFGPVWVICSKYPLLLFILCRRSLQPRNSVL